MGWTGVFALASALQGSAALAQVPPIPPACSEAGHDQFDFWLGEWDVFPNIKVDPAKPVKLPLIARSRIEKLYGGCAIRENWMPLKGTGGGSLNSFDPTTKKWHQTWIGSQPGRVEFDGGLTGGSMVLTGFWANVNGPGQDALIRMSYVPQPDGSVRQHGEQSTDHGLTWSSNFDFVYRRRTDASMAK